MASHLLCLGKRLLKYNAIFMDLKKIAQNLLPYGYIAKRYNNISKVESLLNEFSESDFIDLSIPVESRFKSIVSVQGFGYSGSGTVVDFLREFSNCQVIGYVSIEGSRAPRNHSMAEVDFLRLAGGLFEIEKYMESNNLFHDDALIHRTMSLFGSSYLFGIPEIRLCFLSFLKAIIDFSLPDLSHAYYNSYLTAPRTKTSIYFLRKMPISDYRLLCQNFLNSIFNKFSLDNIDFFVGDQLFSDFEFDMERNLGYIPNLKCILVPRDPRDLYAWTNYKKVEWIPQELNSFIKWYKKTYSNLYTHAKESLIVKYESICLDYAKEYKRIVDYLGLDESLHIKKQECFNPEASSKFVNIWKKSEVPHSEFDVLKTELEEYCCSLVD